eukprot:955824_1
MATQQVLMHPVNGETNAYAQTQAVVVVQQQQPQISEITDQTVIYNVASDEGNRFARYSYLIFCVGMVVYHFINLIWSLFLILFTSGYTPLICLGFALPSIICFIWIINDSTVFCVNCNPSTGDIHTICCCNCRNCTRWIMTIPIAIATLLRFIFWCVCVGIATDVLNAFNNKMHIDNVFWMILSVGSIDVGPLILLSIDWWLYYGKRDYNGLFGNKLYPFRCIVGQSIIIMICSWSFIAAFEESAYDVAQHMWLYIVHGILSSAILIIVAFLQFSGSIQGRFVSNIIYKFVCWGLGVAQGILVLIVWGYIFRYSSPSPLLFFQCIFYYHGLTVPIIWACFSIQVNENNDN